MRRVIVCGSRSPEKLGLSRGRVCELLYEALDVPSRNDTIVVHGAAPGVDSIAAEAAEIWGLCREAHPVNWRLGPRAGPLRNQEMVNAGAEFVVALPGGAGTADCVRRARTAGIDVREVGP